MCGKKCLLVTAIVLVFIFAIPLGITSIFFQKDPAAAGCNLNNVAGHDLSKLLYGINITGIFVFVAIALLLFILICLRKIPIFGIVVSIILDVIIVIIWIMVAIYVFFNYGSSCLAMGLTYFGYAAVLIVLAVITFLAMR